MELIKNMGVLDKRLRLIVAALIALFYFLGFIKGTVAVVLLCVGIVLALTSLLSFCPLYKIAGVNICKVK